MSKVIIKATALGKSYQEGHTHLHVLNGIDFAIRSGDRIAILGPSGSGKSTLLHLLGGLDKPSQGQVQICGSDWQELSERQRCQMRNKLLGFIYQFHHLLPEFTALENVAMPILLAGGTVVQAQQQSAEMLTRVGLEARMFHKPSELSGGERQRVAIARALIHRPECVFADEPTGNLDRDTATKVFDVMVQLNSQHHTALVIVTHDISLAKQMNRVLTIVHGKLVESPGV